MRRSRIKQSLESYYTCPFQINVKARLRSKTGKFFCAVKQKGSIHANKEWSEFKSKHECECGILTDEQLNEQLKIAIKNCGIIQTLVKAFENREYEIIHNFFKEITDYQEWQTFVVYTTGIGWSRWEMHIGTWLLRECRSDPQSPFKAMLPESNRE